MITIFGIRNCDTCKKVIKHFAGKAEFVDVRIEPLSIDTLNRFLIEFDDQLINKRSRTWKDLSPAEKELPPLNLLKNFPTIMKRPIIECSDTLKLSIGWSSDVQSQYS